MRLIVATIPERALKIIIIILRAGRAPECALKIIMIILRAGRAPECALGRSCEYVKLK